jgi:hypothetical protein
VLDRLATLLVLATSGLLVATMGAGHDDERGVLVGDVTHEDILPAGEADLGTARSIGRQVD